MLLEEKLKISEVFEFSILPCTQNWKFGNLGNFYFTSIFDSSCNVRCKNDKNLTETKTEKSRYNFRRKKENFWGFQIFDFVLYPKSKTGNLGKCSFTSNFDNSCNLRFKNDKNELRQKLKGQDMLLEEKRKFPRFPSFRFCPIS